MRVLLTIVCCLSLVEKARGMEVTPAIPTPPEIITTENASISSDRGHESTFTKGRFDEIFSNQNKRRPDSARTIQEQRQRFNEATEALSASQNSENSESLKNFYDGLFWSSLKSDDILKASRSEQLEKLRNYYGENSIYGHLSRNPKLPASQNAQPQQTPLANPYKAIKDKHLKAARSDYAHAQTVADRILHRPPLFSVFAAGLTAAGLGYGVPLLKKLLKAAEVDAFSHYILRHRVLSAVGFAEPKQLVALLNNPSQRRRLDSKKIELLNRYIEVEQKYRRNTRSWRAAIGSLGGAAIMGLWAIKRHLNYNPLT